MTQAEPSAADPLVINSSRHFTSWLAETRCSLAFTTYQAGKVFFIGLQANGRMSVFERTLARSMGMGVAPDGRSFALATLYQIFRFDNVVPAGASHGDSDALYAPHAAWVTGDLDVHDLAMPASGRPVFVNTLFSCLAEVSDGHSFRPLWRPPFVSRLAAEDRCHLNGMAFDEGRPRYVTAVSTSDVTDSWRDHRSSGGVVVDVASGEIVARGLSMPHSPRLHQGRLWLLNSGRGELGHVDLATGRFEPVAFCPGYARGLAFIDRYAIVGLSLSRDARTFRGLPLDEALERKGAVARCGLLVIDLASGDTAHWLRIEGVVRELYDVAVLPGVRNAACVGFVSEDVHRVISIDED